MIRRDNLRRAGLGDSRRDGVEAARYRWYALALATYSQGSVVTLSAGVGPLAPLLQADFGVSRAELGLLVTFIYASYVVAGPIAGRLADRVGERRVMLASALISGSSALLLAGVSQFWAFLAVSLLVGLGNAIQNPVGTAVVLRWFPARMRGLAMGIRQTGVPIGGIVAAALWPVIALAHGWRAAYVVGGILVLVGGILLALTYRDPAPLPGARAVRPPSLGKLLRDRRVWCLGLVFNAGVMAQFTTSAYFVLFLHEVLAVPVVTASAMLGVINGSAIVARIIWGLVSDRYAGGQRRPILITILALAFVSMLGAAALPPAAPLPLVVGLALLIGLSAFAWTGVLGNLVVETVGRESAATTLAIVMAFSSPASLFGPPLFGLIVDQTGSYRTAWLVDAGVVLTGLLAIFGVDERRARA